MYSSVNDKILAQTEMANGVIRLNLTKELARMVDWKNPILIGIVEHQSAERGIKQLLFLLFLI